MAATVQKVFCINYEIIEGKGMTQKREKKLKARS
jgi:hypothetical protein